MTIEISNLRKTFGETAAVAGLDLDIAKGEMLVLLGPSGCGKTTTMRCIAGLETPNSGRIALSGRVVFDDKAGINVPINKRRVGMVFQSYAIWPHMTVFKNVSFPLEMENVPHDTIKRRVTDILKLVGLAGLEERGASYLSGGQMQRVALARSLVMEPAVLLFDEPLSNLDARLRDHLRVQLRELQTQLKITSVYVTHDQREALALADKIVVMETGHVQQVADPVTLYRRPRTAAIADFLGYSNVFDVTVAARETGSTSVTLAATGAGLSSIGSLPEEATAIAACVRPEDVVVAVGRDATQHNAMEGEVLLVSFVGSHMQYRVKVGDGVVWEALSRDVGATIRIGDKVTVSVDPACVLLLPKE
jgi:iron(III) transport system ATP-binding protein